MVGSGGVKTHVAKVYIEMVLELDQEKLCKDTPLASFGKIGSRFSICVGSSSFHGTIKRTSDPKESCELHQLQVTLGAKERNFDEDDVKIVYRRLLKLLGEDSVNADIRVVFCSHTGQSIPNDQDRALQAFRGTGSCATC